MSSKIFVVSGASGCGKTTIMKAVMDNELISVTTREPRSGEVEGVTYYYINQEQYKELYESDQLAEWSNYYGHGTNYGLTYSEIDERLKDGDCFFISDYNGMLQMKDLEMDAVEIITIFIYANKATAELNMRKRGDDEDFIVKRLSSYEKEVRNMQQYDYVISNEYKKLKESIAEARKIIGG